MENFKRAKTFAIIIGLVTFLGLPLVFLAGVFWQESTMIIPVMGIIWVFGLIFAGINFVAVDELEIIFKKVITTINGTMAKNNSIKDPNIPTTK